MLRSALTLFVLLLLVTILQAQQKPHVFVTFNIQDTVYQKAMEANEEISTLEDYISSGTDVIATSLKAAFPFIDFTTEASPDTFTFILARKTLAINILDTLKTRSGEGVVGKTMQFRGITEVETQAPANLDAFVEELRNKCTTWITQYRDNLVQDVFSHIRLCDQATASPSSGDWIMPFTKNTLSIGLGSNLLVKTFTSSKICEFYTKAAGPPDFAPDGNLICSFVKDQVNVGCLNQILQSSIEGVYLIKFEKPVLSEVHPQ